MQFTTLASLLLAATSVSAALLTSRQSDLPQCFLTCTMGPNVDYHGCGNTDNPCLCKNADFVSDQKKCLAATCDSADLATSVQISTELCAKVGVTGPATSATTATGATTDKADTTPAATNPTATTPTATTPAGTSTGSAPAQTSNAAFTKTGTQFTLAALVVALGVVAL